MADIPYMKAKVFWPDNHIGMVLVMIFFFTVIYNTYEGLTVPHPFLILTLLIPTAFAYCIYRIMINDEFIYGCTRDWKKLKGFVPLGRVKLNRNKIEVIEEKSWWGKYVSIYEKSSSVGIVVPYFSFKATTVEKIKQMLKP